MKCPLFLTGEHASGEYQKGYDTDCLQGECAWWSIFNKKCGVMGIMINLMILVEASNRLATIIKEGGKR